MNTVAKNLSYLACLCLICCGAMLLAGCGGTMDVTSINITKDPDKVNYVVGEDLSLAGGEFTVTRDNGQTEVFDLQYADPSITHFANAGEYTIVMTYEGKTSTFNVTVEKAEYAPNYEKNIEATYTGSPLPVTLIDTSALPTGVSVLTTEYKAVSAPDTAYSPIAPVEAGEYLVRMSLNGGKNYKITTPIIANYTVHKADLRNFATNGVLSFHGIANITYGETFDLSQTWEQDDQGQVLGAVPLPSTIASSLTYYYQGANDAEPIAFTPGTDGEIYRKLNAGTYTITVSAPETENLNAFSVTKTMTINSKALEIGVDYDIILTTASGTTYLGAGESAVAEVPVMASASDVSIALVFKGDATNYCDAGETKYKLFFGNSIGMEYEGTSSVTDAGYYRVQISSLACSNDNYYVDSRIYVAFHYTIV